MKIKILLLIIGFGLVGIIIYPLLILAYMFLGTFFLPNPPEPKIKYGEFPFKLEYKINGERKLIEDTLICKYDGIDMIGVGEKRRKWKSYLKNGSKKIILLQINDTDYIYYNPGSPEYYMGDEYIYTGCMGDSRNKNSYYEKFTDASFFKKYEDGQAEGIIRAEELIEKYDIELISWEPSPPIINEFN